MRQYEGQRGDNLDSPHILLVRCREETSSVPVHQQPVHPTDERHPSNSPSYSPPLEASLGTHAVSHNANCTAFPSSRISAT